jgi:hypothetical protein
MMLMATRARTPTLFSELFPPRGPQRRGLPLLFLDATGAADPTRGYGSSTHSLDAEMERIREETTGLVETGYLANDPRTTRLVWWLRRMGYDDALVWDEWRVELLYLDTGQPHFRVYWRGFVFGVVGIATSHADLGCLSRWVGVVAGRYALDSRWGHDAAEGECRSPVSAV